MVGISQGWDFAKKREKGEFPGSLVVWIQAFTTVAWVQPLVKELKILQAKQCC